MNVHPASRRGLVVLLALTVGLVVVAPPVPASVDTSGPQPEIGTKVKVKGKALKRSDEVGTKDDPAIGKTAPRLSGRGLDGKRVVFANAGTPRLVIFLAHWCPHCRAEVPLLVEMAEKGELDGVEIDTVTTNTDESAPNYPPSKWLEREKWPFTPVLADDADLRAFLAFGGQAFPYFVAIDADGKVAARADGELSESAIVRIVERLVAGDPVFS